MNSLSCVCPKIPSEYFSVSLFTFLIFLVFCSLSSVIWSLWKSALVSVNFLTCPISLYYALPYTSNVRAKFQDRFDSFWRKPFTAHVIWIITVCNCDPAEKYEILAQAMLRVQNFRVLDLLLNLCGCSLDSLHNFAHMIYFKIVIIDRVVYFQISSMF